MGFFSNLWDTITKNPIKVLIDPIGTVTRGVTEEVTGLSDVEQLALAGTTALAIAAPPLAAATQTVKIAGGGFNGMRPPVPQPTAGGPMPFSLTSQGTGFTAGLGQVARDLALQAGGAFIQSRIGPGGGAVGPSPNGIQTAGLRIPGGTMGPATVAGSAVMAGRAVLNVIKDKVALAVGKRMSIRRIAQMIKRLGPSVAGIALGLTAVEIAQVLAATPSRRARGISASNIRTTKRTIKKIIGVACQVQQVGSIKVSGMRRGCKS